jgi:hypothetical protein
LKYQGGNKIYSANLALFKAKFKILLVSQMNVKALKISATRQNQFFKAQSTCCYKISETKIKQPNKGCTWDWVMLNFITIYVPEELTQNTGYSLLKNNINIFSKI